MFKITGLDKLNQNLDAVQKAILQLDGELVHVQFDPFDPGSIEAASAKLAQLIDERLGQHASNPIVEALAEQMKEKYRQMILDRAAASRATAEGDADGK